MTLLPTMLPSGLITNEFAFWNPNDPKAVKTPYIDVTSGALYLLDSAGWTGVPDEKNNSVIFRLDTKRADYRDVKIHVNMMNMGLTSTVKTPPKDWDGFHVWPRYISETLLYIVSVHRRSNSCIIKKKVTGGPNPSNGGTYYPLTKDIPLPVIYNVWQNVEVVIKNVGTTAVMIYLCIEGKCVMYAIDNGSVGGPPLLGPGKIGLRGDNCQLKFANFEVFPG